jgi:hypothetical protein
LTIGILAETNRVTNNRKRATPMRKSLRRLDEKGFETLGLLVANEEGNIIRRGAATTYVF